MACAWLSRALQLPVSAQPIHGVRKKEAMEVLWSPCVPVAKWWMRTIKGDVSFDSVNQEPPSHSHTTTCLMKYGRTKIYPFTHTSVDFMGKNRGVMPLCRIRNSVFSWGGGLWGAADRQRTHWIKIRSKRTWPLIVSTVSCPQQCVDQHEEALDSVYTVRLQATTPSYSSLCLRGNSWSGFIYRQPLADLTRAEQSFERCMGKKKEEKSQFLCLFCPLCVACLCVIAQLI